MILRCRGGAGCGVLAIAWSVGRSCLKDAALLGSDSRQLLMFFSESSPVLLQRSSRKYTTEEAVDLHDTVPPDHWCVTRSDLQYLQREVQRAIDVGEIQPPEDGTDDFKACGEQYGPSIYTVNIQHIMPVTEMAGKVSWALMRHPEGLECELFISHAWQEGIFEFLSKVLHSWPTDVRHAWCCMLANPQNLDIGAMLLSPSTSPFALALEASTYVLVVPNRHCSIYTRRGDAGTQSCMAAALD